MNYARRIAMAAVTGAVVSSVISANRKAIGQLLSIRTRKQQIDELQTWYESELQAAEQYADDKSTLFIEQNRDYFLEMIKDEEYPESVVRGSLEAFRISVRELIGLNRKIQVTRDYGIRLYPLNPKRAYEFERDAAELMAHRDDVTRRMSMAGYPVNEIYEWMRVNKRT
jgi:hypothetical protein